MSAALVLGILIGAILGLTGAGGGMLAVPALVAGLDLSMQQAAPISLIAVSASAAIGAWHGFRHRLLRLRGALLMAAAGAPFTWAGVSLAQHISQSLLQTLFALAMLAAAIRMLQASAPGAQETDVARIAKVCETTGRFTWNWPTALLLAGIGSICGLMTGLLGVGGGFIMVPLLRRFSNVSMHGVVATSLAVIAMVGGVGIATSLAHGTQIPLTITLWFAGSCMVGMLAGRKLSQHLSASMVQRGFAMLLFIIALVMLWRAWNV